MAAFNVAATQSEFRLNEVRPRRPEQSGIPRRHPSRRRDVSMKSGLEGRNNVCRNPGVVFGVLFVSMKSGLEGRNNC